MIFWGILWTIRRYGPLPERCRGDSYTTDRNIEGFTRTATLVKENADCLILLVVDCGSRFSATHSFMEWLGKFIEKD